MGLQDIATATIFYLPFILTLFFAFLALLVGIATIFSGTLLLLLFAAYGLYGACRDVGILGQCIHYIKTSWTFLSQDVIQNMQKTFVLKSIENLPSEPALFICHPHGLFGHSWLLHFCYGISSWPEEKPKPLLAIHSILFQLPFLRDILEQCRCIEATEDNIKAWLSKGYSVAILTGGIEEMKHNGSESVKLVLEKRKGYARIARQCKVPIVPMFTVGENELFPNESFWAWKSINRLVYKWTGIPLPLPSWKSMISWTKILQGPLTPPVQSCILHPVSTQDKEESQIRKECVTTMKTFLREQHLNAQIIA